MDRLKDEFGVAAGFSASVAVMGSPSSDTENLTEGMNVDELSLYTTPPQKLHYVEQEKGVMEENVTLLRNMAEPYITWCQLCHDGDSYVYLRNPPPEFYPRAGVIGFTGILGLFLARGSRMKRLIYPTGLMAVGASMYYPQKAATIAKSTGDAVYEFTLQAYVTVEKLITGKSAVKPEEKSTGDAVYEFTLQAYVTVEKLITGKSAVKPEEKVRKAEEK
ncbi:MICOS complex subunit MIC26 [Silurus meridionalis]|nr:MICOS complex subunit MIC26 [Silurus meridionalis]